MKHGSNSTNAAELIVTAAALLASAEILTALTWTSSASASVVGDCCDHTQSSTSPGSSGFSLPPAYHPWPKAQLSSTVQSPA